jgi:hypothetical protein
MTNSQGRPTEKFPREAERYEVRAAIENGDADLHRPVDTKSFVFAEREALSTRAATPPPRKRLTAHAYQNSAQSRIHRINLQARVENEGPYCRVFLDPSGQDDHRSTPGYVPLGETTPQGGDR